MKKRVRIIALILVAASVFGVCASALIMLFAKAVDKVYNIAILSDKSISSACDDQAIGKLYTDAGHVVDFVDRGEFADPQKFNASVCDILIIPTGENFPAEAVSNFKKFVAEGGRVITLGGYAFSKLLDTQGKDVTPNPADLSAGDKDLLLGSNAPLYAQDQLRFEASQIPIFDEEHHYDSGVSIRPAEDQAVFEGELLLSGSKLIQGYSAITTTGNYRGRWQPLIYAYDHVGTRVGTVGAIFRIYSQPRSEGAHGMFPTWNAYKGTSIAFFGVTSHDLLLDGNQALRDGFVKLADVLMEDTYIASIENKYNNYKQGEKPEFDIYVENGSKQTQTGSVELDIISEDTNAVVATLKKEYSVTAKNRQTVKITWDNATFEDDFYQVNARVHLADGTVIDRYQTGFSVWNEDVIAAGPKYRYEDNYIKLQQEDGSYKTIFATGVDDGGNLLINEDQTPLVWKQEFIRRQDTGMYIYECLQQYRNAGDFAHLFKTPEALEKHYRSVDNIVYLSQKYGQIYMMGIAIGDDVSAGGDALEKIADDVGYMARRYKDVPGLIYYLNGDLICRVNNAKNKADFNAFLRLRYGTNQLLNASWGTTGLELGNVDLDNTYSYNGSGWTDNKAYDINLFKTTLITRWTNRLHRAIKENDGSDRIVLCEFYSWPAESVDIPLALGDMTYSNIGFFQTREEFVQTLAYTDQRFNGKSFGIGETGRRTHPSFLGSELIYRSAGYDESRDFFFTGLISTFAMGGNHYQQWCWNDESKYVFPWGMNFTGDKAPRDLYYWYRNTNFVLKQTEPIYKTPEVAIILPDSTRASGSQIWYGGHYGSVNALDFLQSTGVDAILTLNESNLVIDPAIKVIYYPMAYTVPQNVYDTLKAWVEQGGTLYISGDFTYDPLNKERLYEHRLEELAGVRSTKVRYAGLDQRAVMPVDYTNGTTKRYGVPNLKLELAGAQTLFYDADNMPVIVKNQLGAGTVIYSADPFEYQGESSLRKANVALYRSVLDVAGVSYTVLNADAENLKLFRQPLVDGGTFYEILNVANQKLNASVRVNGKNYDLSMVGCDTDYLRFGKDGQLLSVLCEGNLIADDRLIVQNGAFAHITTMDGMDITQSKRIVVMPQQTGVINLQTDANWDKLSVRIGQVENGMWIDMGQVVFTLTNGKINIGVTENMVNAIILIGETLDVLDQDVHSLGFAVADHLVTGGARGCTTAAAYGGINQGYGLRIVPQIADGTQQSVKKNSGIPFVIGGIVVGLACGAGIVAWINRKKRKLEN